MERVTSSSSQDTYYYTLAEFMDRLGIPGPEKPVSVNIPGHELGLARYRVSVTTEPTSEIRTDERS